MRVTFLRVGRRAPALMYEPEGLDGEKLTTVLVMHPDEDYLTCPTGPELARRGFRVVCANVPVKEGLFFSQNDKYATVQAAIENLRGRENVGAIVLMGHSGGTVTARHYDRPAGEMFAESVADAYHECPYDAGWDWA